MRSLSRVVADLPPAVDSGDFNLDADDALQLCVDKGRQLHVSAKARRLVAGGVWSAPNWLDTQALTIPVVPMEQ